MALTRQRNGELTDEYGFPVRASVILDSTGAIKDEFGGDGALEDSEAHAGEVGWSQGSVYINPTVTAGAYAAGEVVGGEITLTNFMRASGGSAQAYGVHLVDVSNQKPTLEFILFDQAPTANIADNAAYTEHASDPPKEVMHFTVDFNEWRTVGGVAHCSKALSAFPVTASGSANLYLYIVTVNAVTFAAATDLHIRFGATRA